METIVFENDITVMCITAASFPQGVLATHQKLHSLIPFSTDRKYLGISRPENGIIVYKAAAEEMKQGEAEQLKLDTLVLKSGNYISITIHDYMKDIPAIEKTFTTLLAHPGLDPEGYCVEWYTSDKDVNCMIRLTA